MEETRRFVREGEGKTNCSLEHNHIDHEGATEVVWVLQVISLNLMLLHRWKSIRGRKPGMGELAEMLTMGLATLRGPFLLRPG